MRLRSYRTSSAHLLLHQVELSHSWLIWPNYMALHIESMSLQTLAPLLNKDRDTATNTANALCDGANLRPLARNLAAVIDRLYDEDPHDEAIVLRSRGDRDAMPLHAMLDARDEHRRLCARDAERNGSDHAWIDTPTEAATLIWHVDLLSGAATSPDPIKVNW